MDKWMNGQRHAAIPINPVTQKSNHPFHLVAGRWRGLNKKPTTVSSRGFLSKLNLTTTSADGVGNDDDY